MTALPDLDDLDFSSPDTLAILSSSSFQEAKPETNQQQPPMQYQQQAVPQ
jgi:hypothetical protein